MLDTPVGVLVQKMAPQFASMLPADYAKQPLRQVMREANFVVKSLITSKIGPYLPPGVTFADLEKAVNQPPPPPEAKPVAVAPATASTTVAAPATPVAGAPAAASKGSTTLPQPTTPPPKQAVAAPPPVAAPAAASTEPGRQTLAAAPAAPAGPALLPQARPEAAGARPVAADAGASAGPWQDYINAHGGHATTVKDGKLVNVPLGTPGQYNNLDPVLGSRLYKAAQAYKAETGLEPRFNEGTRGNDVQAVHYKNLEGGKLGPVAHPQDASHRGSNHLHGEAFDIPTGPFLNWLHAHALNYGLAFPVKKDAVHVELAAGTPRQSDYTGGVSAPATAGASAAGAPAAGAPAAGAPAAGAPAAGAVPDTGRYYPKGTDMATVSSIGALAARLGVSPAAIAGVIKTESNWDRNATSPGGKYHGLTQMGPATFNEAGGKLNGLTYEEYLKASPDKQVDTYGAWLDHYGFSDKFKNAHIDLSKMTPAQQAAYLQAFQFSPAVSNWIGGDANAPVTHSPQSGVLGNTSLAAMTKYYEGLLSTEKGDPATASGGTTEPAATPAADPAATPATPTADASKHGLGGGMGGFGEALSAMAGGMYGGGKSGGASQTASGPTTIPMVQLPRPSGPVPIVDPRMADMQRQQLAHALQRLNSGKLV